MADNYLEYKMEDMRKGKFKPFRLPKKKKTQPKPEEKKEGDGVTG